MKNNLKELARLMFGVAWLLAILTAIPKMSTFVSSLIGIVAVNFVGLMTNFRELCGAKSPANPKMETINEKGEEGK